MKMAELKMFRLSAARFGIVAMLFVSVFSLEKPEDFSEEMYCTACEITIKELDRFLRIKPTRPLGEVISRSLKRVCKKESFQNYEFDGDKLFKACKHFVGDGKLEAELFSLYSKKHQSGLQTSYLDVSQEMCGRVLHACTNTVFITGDNMEEDGGIAYDPKTGDFTVKPGKKVRYAGSAGNKTPVKQIIDQPVEQTIVLEDVEEELELPGVMDMREENMTPIHVHDEF